MTNKKLMNRNRRINLEIMALATFFIIMWILPLKYSIKSLLTITSISVIFTLANKLAIKIYGTDLVAHGGGMVANSRDYGAAIKYPTENISEDQMTLLFVIAKHLGEHYAVKRLFQAILPTLTFATLLIFNYWGTFNLMPTMIGVFALFIEMMDIYTGLKGGKDYRRIIGNAVISIGISGIVLLWIEPGFRKVLDFFYIELTTDFSVNILLLSVASCMFFLGLVLRFKSEEKKVPKLMNGVLKGIAITIWLALFLNNLFIKYISSEILISRDYALTVALVVIAVLSLLPLILMIRHLMQKPDKNKKLLLKISLTSIGAIVGIIILFWKIPDLLNVLNVMTLTPGMFSETLKQWGIPIVILLIPTLMLVIFRPQTKNQMIFILAIYLFTVIFALTLKPIYAANQIILLITWISVLYCYLKNSMVKSTSLIYIVLLAIDAHLTGSFFVIFPLIISSISTFNVEKYFDKKTGGKSESGNYKKFCKKLPKWLDEFRKEIKEIRKCDETEAKKKLKPLTDITDNIDFRNINDKTNNGWLDPTFLLVTAMGILILGFTMVVLSFASEFRIQMVGIILMLLGIHEMRCVPKRSDRELKSVTEIDFDDNQKKLIEKEGGCVKPMEKMGVEKGVTAFIAQLYLEAVTDVNQIRLPIDITMTSKGNIDELKEILRICFMIKPALERQLIENISSRTQKKMLVYLELGLIKVMPQAASKYEQLNKEASLISGTAGRKNVALDFNEVPEIKTKEDLEKLEKTFPEYFLIADHKHFPNVVLHDETGKYSNHRKIWTYHVGLAVINKNSLRFNRQGYVEDRNEPGIGKTTADRSFLFFLKAVDDKKTKKINGEDYKICDVSLIEEPPIFASAVADNYSQLQKAKYSGKSSGNRLFEMSSVVRTTYPLKSLALMVLLLLTLPMSIMLGGFASKNLSYWIFGTLVLSPFTMIAYVFSIRNIAKEQRAKWSGWRGIGGFVLDLLVTTDSLIQSIALPWAKSNASSLSLFPRSSAGTSPKPRKLFANFKEIFIRGGYFILPLLYLTVYLLLISLRDFALFISLILTVTLIFYGFFMTLLWPPIKEVGEYKKLPLLN